MIGDSVRYVRESDDALKTILIGGLLLLFSFLIIPSILVLGFISKVLERTMTDDDTPPTFGDWGDLFSDGLRLFVVVFVYGLVPVILGGLLFSIGFASAASGDAGAGLAVMVLGGLVWFIVSVAFGYIVPAAVANAVENQSIGAGFSFGTIKEAIMTGTYFTGWLYAFAVMIGTGIVAGALNVIPLLGQLLSTFVFFYGIVAAYYIIGHTWGDLHPVEMGPDDTMGEQPAV